MATFDGDSNHTGSTDSKSITIAKASSSLTVNCPASATYTGSPIELCTASYSGAGDLSGTLTPTYADNVNVGTATASAIFGGDPNHEGSGSSATFEIIKASTTTTVTCPTSATYTGSALAPCSVTVTGANLSLSPAPVYANNVNAGTASASYSNSPSARLRPRRQ